MTFDTKVCVLAALMLLPAAGAAAADDAPRFAGPLFSPGAPLPQGRFNIEPYLFNSQVRGRYDGNGDRHDATGPDSWRLAVPMQYGLHDRLTLGLSLNATYDRAPGYTRAFDIGDTTVSALFGAWRSEGPERATLTLAVRQRIATGHHDRLQDRSISIASGQGVASTSLGVHGQAYFLEGRLRARASTLWRIPGASADVRGESAYGTERTFQGRVRLGSSQDSTVAAEYSLTPRWVVAGELLHERSGGNRLRGHSGSGTDARQIDRRDPAGWRLSVLPAVQYHFNDHVAVLTGVQVSVAGRNTAAVVVPQVAVNVAF